MKKRQFDLPVTGSASLLMSVVLVVLAMLSLVSLGHARADRRTADSAEKAIAEYYAADMEAEKILALLKNGLPVEDVTEKDGVYFYQCFVSEGRFLFVEVEKETWEILRWEVADEQTQ